MQFVTHLGTLPGNRDMVWLHKLHSQQKAYSFQLLNWHGQQGFKMSRCCHLKLLHNSNIASCHYPGKRFWGSEKTRLMAPMRWMPKKQSTWIGKAIEHNRTTTNRQRQWETAIKSALETTNWAGRWWHLTALPLPTPICFWNSAAHPLRSGNLWTCPYFCIWFLLPLVLFWRGTKATGLAQGPWTCGTNISFLFQTWWRY